MVTGEIFMLILMALISIYALYYSWTHKGKFQRLITSGFSFAIFILWLGGDLVSNLNFFLTLVFSVTTFVYALITKQLTFFERLTTGSLGLFLALLFAAKFLALPGAAILRVSLVIPLLLFFITNAQSSRQDKKEFGFSLLIAFYLILELSKFITN